MAADFTIKRNDRQPYIGGTLTGGGTVPDVALAGSVVFHLASAVSGSVVVSGAAVVHSAADWTVHYEWGTADTATAGMYHGEFQVTLNDGKTITFPNTRKPLTVEITPDLA